MLFWGFTGKFSGFMMTRMGIKENSNKFPTIFDMRIPITMKEVQHQIEHLTVLSRILSCVGDKAFHFFLHFEEYMKFEWKNECEEAFVW